MAKIKYRQVNLRPDSLRVVTQAEAICSEYAARGLSITLRQCYYQFVARGLLENSQANYKRLGSILNDARMGGLFDWDYLIDRTRNLVRQATWDSPSTLIRSAASQYATDLWRPQRQRVEVWIEKDAGIGTIEAVCDSNQVPYFACRGYNSASEMWAAAQRVGNYLRRGEKVTILHIGDHDPSGLDMTRDMKERLALFVLNDWNKEFSVHARRSSEIYDSIREGMRQMGSAITDQQAPFQIRRIALSMDQVRQYDPPPNPAKLTDSRIDSYLEITGGLEESWELDALDPMVLQELIQDHIDSVVNEAAWESAVKHQERDRAVLTKVSEKWAQVVDQFGEKLDIDTEDVGE